MDNKLKRASKMRDNRSGMTLIEVIIAIVLLSIVLIAIISLSNVSITGIFTAGAKSKAIAAAMEKGDQIYYIVTNAEDADQAEEDMRSTPGWVESSLYFSSVLTEPQFFYEKTSYEVNGDYSEGFNVTVIVYFGDGKQHVDMQFFVLKE